MKSINSIGLTPDLVAFKYSKLDLGFPVFSDTCLLASSWLKTD